MKYIFYLLLLCPAFQTYSVLWPQLCDAKGWEAEIVSRYQLKGIPSNWLLDSTGRIIAMDLDAERLEQAFQELFPPLK